MSAASPRKLRVLAITNLFPNAVMPHAAAFNRQQLGALNELCDLRILATIPWYPGAGLIPRSILGELNRLPRFEQIDNLTVEHPRTLYVPLVGRGLSGTTHAMSLQKIVGQYADEVDVLFGAWVYPDGVATIKLGRKFDLPVVVKCFGSDLNTLPNYSGPRRQIQEHLPGVDGFVAVSEPLRRKAIDLGVPADRVDVVIDGVNRDLFHPSCQQTAREKLGLPTDRKFIVYVGRTVLAKGLNELIAAYEVVHSKLPDVELAIVGDGADHAALREQAAASSGKIHFAGARELDEIPHWLAAADVVTLPSYAEGLPNTVLEALACGRPVVATDVGGIPDVLSNECGQLIPPRDIPALADALYEVLQTNYDPDEIAISLPQRDWYTSATQLLGVLQKAVDRYLADSFLVSRSGR